MEGNGTNGQKSLRVLIAEDDRGVRDLLVDILNMSGVQVKCNSVETVEGALDQYMWSDGAYDLILSDLNQQPVTGLDLVKAIKGENTKQNPQTQVYIITGGSSDVGLVADAKAFMGEKYFIQKPFKVKHISDLIQEAYAKKYSGDGNGTGKKPTDTRRYVIGPVQ